MSDFLLLTDKYLDLYDDLNKRRNELDSYSYILSKVNSNTYQESAMIRSGIVTINSHYEWCIKRVFELYLEYIYTSENKNFKDIFYYDSLDKINKWKLVNNIKIWKMKELMVWLGLSYENFLNKINNDLLQKRLFIDEVTKNNFKNNFYVFDKWLLNTEKTLINIIDNTLIQERNSIWHWDLKKADQKLFYILKLFILLYLNSFIVFIIENIEQKNYLNK